MILFKTLLKVFPRINLSTHNIVTIFYYITVEYDLIVPEDGIVAIPHSNSEDDLTIPLQRALPPSGEESMALAIESLPSPNSTYTYLLEYHFDIFSF